MSKIHLELLDNTRLRVFQTLSEFKAFGYLAGGTALALQINHRISEDFDIFVYKSIDNNLRQKINQLFPKAEYTLNTGDQINIISKDGIKITFLWYYFDIQSKLINTDSISLASIDDIICDKAHTIGRRAVWRDYVDMFYVLKNNAVNLKTILLKSKTKFKTEFNEVQFLEQLRYFSDVDPTPIHYISTSYKEDEIKDFLSKTVEDYLKGSVFGEGID